MTVLLRTSLLGLAAFAVGFLIQGEPAEAARKSKASAGSLTVRCNQIARERFPLAEQDRDRSRFVKSCRQGRGV